MTGYTPPAIGSTAWGGPLNDIIEEIDADMQARPLDEDVVHLAGDEAITGIKEFGTGITIPAAGLPITAIAGLRVELDDLTGGYTTRTRETITYTTASLATDAVELGTIALPLGYTIYRVEVDRAARIRTYATEAQGAADETRVFGVVPTGDHGLMFDCLIDPAGSLDIAPPVPGMNMELEGDVAISVTNLGTTGTVEVVITYLRTE